MLHRDVSFNNILIREWKDDSGHTMRQGILADWELSKYREDMGESTKPRQPDHTVRSAFLSSFKVMLLTLL